MNSRIAQYLRSSSLYQRYAQAWINDMRYALRNLRLYFTEYQNGNAIHPAGKKLFFILDPKQKHPGFADRLKVFCCLHRIAQHSGMEIKLVLDEKFPLERYLEPANNDWRASWTDLSHCRSEVKLTAYNGGKHKLPVICTDKPQTHIYNYIGLDIIRRTEGNQWRNVWKRHFDQMFKPTEYLQSLLSQYAQNEPYTACHIRFVNALDHLEDGYYNELTADDQQKLIDKCLAALTDIRQQEKRPLLIFSDSERFLNAAKEHGFGRIEGGKIGHVSFCSEAMEKTVIDFFMLSKAQRIIRLTCPEVYGSTFPIYASFVGNCQIWEYEVDKHHLSQMPY